MKQQKYKKILSIYLIMMMLIGLFSGAGLQPAFAISPDIDFGFDSSTGTITSYSGAGGDIVIPSVINGVPVTAIGYGTFSAKTSITSVTIPNSVTSMATNTFNGCTALKSVVLSNGLTELSNQIFLDCNALEIVEVPEGITSIGTYAFGNCYALKSVKLPTTLEVIKASAFSDCTALTEITLPAALKTISGYAFEGTTSLKAIYFEGNYPTLEGGYFTGLSNDIHFYYEHNNTGFADYSSQYVALYSLTTETTSGSSILVMPNSSPNINLKWFTEGANIQLTMIPEAGKQFKRGSLHSVDGTTSTLMDSTFIMPNKDLHIIGEFMPIEPTSYDVTIGSVTGGSITSNLSNAYPGEIINLEITPDLGKKLATESFKYTLNNTDYPIIGTSFVMPNGPILISASFEASDFNFDLSTGTITGYVGSEENVVIPSSISGIPVIAIGDNAFKNQPSITSVTIPSSVRSIGSYSFSSCSSLTEITIPEGVTTIGAHAFEYCYALQNVVLPESLTNLGSYTFYNNYALKSVNWPKSLTIMPSSTFSYCTNLKSITIPEGITTVEINAFYHTGFENIIFPASLTTLESNVVGNMSALKSIIFKGNAPAKTDNSLGNITSGLTIYYPEGASDFTNPWLGINTESYNPTATYTLSYDLNGAIGTLTSSITSLHFGDTITVSAQGDLTKGSDVFSGWNTMPDGTGDYYEAGIATMLNKNITLYATWKTNYAISIANTEHGKVETLLDKAVEGTTIYVIVTPGEGYRLKEGSLKYNDGVKDYLITDFSKVPSKPSGALSMAQAPPSGYAFKMPATNVTISAEFEDKNIAFTFDESTGTITKYYGEDSIVIIPTQINGVDVKEIGANAFAGNSLLRAVTFSEGIKSIDIGAFSFCVNLIGITLPESLVDIAPSSFQDTWSLKAVKIPKQVDSIYDHAFANAQELKTVYFEGDAPTDFSSSAFINPNSNFKIIYDSSHTGFDGNNFGSYTRYTRQSFNSAEAVATDLNALVIQSTLLYNKNDADSKDPYTLESSDHIQHNIYLPVVGVSSGSSIVWQSSNPDVIATNGKVTRPVFESGDANVTLTATVSNNGASDTKIFNLTVIKKDYAMTTVSVGFNSNGGTTEANPVLVTVESGKSLISLPTAPTKTGYTFLGWNTMPNGSGTAFLASTVVNSNMTVYAQWQASSSGGNSGGGNGGGSSGGSAATSPTPASKPSLVGGNTSITETVVSEVKIDATGKATASITENEMSEAVKKAIASATQLGAGTKAQVEVKLAATPNAKIIETTMPKATFANIVNSEISALKISSSIANLTFDKQALNTMSQNGVGDVNITITKVDPNTLSEASKQKIGTRPVFDFTVTNDGKTFSQLGGDVTVEVPYTPLAGETSDALVVYYVNDNGELEMINNAHFNSETGMMSFTTNHFSKYMVGYNKIEFTDVVSNAWYYKAINFVSARGIASGTGNSQFSPNEKLTRGQLLVMLMKVYNIKAEENSKENFSDAGNTYYTGYLAAAKKLGITSGVGNNKYAPEKEISRQEMFTLLYNTLKALDQLPQVTNESELDKMSDQSQVAPWAKDAMTLFVNADIASGSAGKVLPKDFTSRAQMAQVLYNLMTK